MVVCFFFFSIKGEKILGGIIGTNIVRYDIFGKDVVIANKYIIIGFIILIAKM